MTTVPLHWRHGFASLPPHGFLSQQSSARHALVYAMHPRKLYVETTTRCNMQCGMCVKQAPGSDISDKHLDFRIFQRLTSSFPHLDALVLNGIGEPLLHPKLIDMVSLAAHRMTTNSWIGFQTNGLLLSEDITKKLLNAGLNKLCISVDSTMSGYPDGSCLLHHKQPHSRIAMVRKICNDGGYNDVDLGAEIVLTRETLPQLPDLIRRLADEGVDFIIGSHLLAYHREAEQSGVFISSTEDAWKIYQKWQALAAAEGLDLASLTAKTWIAPRQIKDHRLQQLYRQMLEEAGENDIWLHLKKLALLDNSECDLWQKYLSEAENMATTLGVEISLPPLFASTKRSCKFMEDNAVLIDVDGSVTPCHPLWHSQTLYMDGEAKILSRQSFGSINDNDLLTIWNTEEYRDFREAAVRYDYPFCHSCSLGPCPDITGESTPFINDCFGTPVPCGHCFWCFDGVRCL